MSDSHNNTSGKSALRSSAILACSIGLALAFPGAPAMAKGAGTGLGTALKAMMGQPVPMSATTGNNNGSGKNGKNGSGKSSNGTSQSGQSGTSISSPLTAQPATPSYSPTTMATASYSQVVMATVPIGSMAMASYSPTTMATATSSPTTMSAPSASLAIIGNSSGHKHPSMTTTRSWLSSGTVWPTPGTAGNAAQSSGKGSSIPKSVTLATWPAVDTSASSGAKH
jgi:hypothetical protein